MRFVRDVNEARVLHLLRRYGYLYRAQLARRLNLTRPVVSDLAAALITRGWILDDATTTIRLRGGRPGRALRLNPSGATLIGIALGNDHITIVILSLDGQVLFRQRRSIIDKTDIKGTLQQITDVVRAGKTALGGRLSNLQGVGIAVPGMLAPDGTVSWLPRLGWRDIDLRGEVRKQLRSEVWVENDANACGLGELFFSEQPHAPDFIYLLFDQGVGSGLVLNGKLYNGHLGGTGEVGHIRLDISGPACACGGKGCLETLVGEEALMRGYRRRGGGVIDNADEVLSGFKVDQAARDTVSEWLDWLARGITSLIYLLQPQEVVLGGAYIAHLPELPELLMARLRSENIAYADKVKLLRASFEHDGVAMGAAALVYRSLFQVQDLSLLGPALVGSSNEESRELAKWM